MTEMVVDYAFVNLLIVELVRAGIISRGAIVDQRKATAAVLAAVEARAYWPGPVPAERVAPTGAPDPTAFLDDAIFGKCLERQLVIRNYPNVHPSIMGAVLTAALRAAKTSYDRDTSLERRVAVAGEPVEPKPRDLGVRWQTAVAEIQALAAEIGGEDVTITFGAKGRPR